jgi:hypothetical protein
VNSHHYIAIRRYAVRLTVVGFAALTAACSGGGSGGGGGSIPSVPQQAGAQSADGAILATISLSIPDATPDATTALNETRRAEDLSPGTSSISVTINNGTPQVIPLGSYAGCAATVGGRTCLVPVIVPAGTNAVKAWAFGTTDASGTPLSVGSGIVTVQSKSSTVVQLTMHPIITRLKVRITPGSPFILGQQSAQTVQIIPLDARGYIIRPANVALIVDQSESPVMISVVDNDVNAATTIAPATLTATPESLTYNGTPVGAGATVFAYARNTSNTLVASASQAIPYTSTPTSATSTPAPGPTPTPGSVVTPTPSATPTPGPVVIPTPSATPSAVPTPKPSATPTPAPTPTPGAITPSSSSLSFFAAGDVHSVTLSQPNYSGAFTVTTVSGDPSAVTASVAGNTVTIVALHAGSTSVVITGGAGSSVAVPATVSSTAITIR